MIFPESSGGVTVFSLQAEKKKSILPEIRRKKINVLLILGDRYGSIRAI
jgi:hypothetical protein